jgi:hypothetical protein
MIGFMKLALSAAKLWIQPTATKIVPYDVFAKIAVGVLDCVSYVIYPSKGCMCGVQVVVRMIPTVTIFLMQFNQIT